MKVKNISQGKLLLKTSKGNFNIPLGGDLTLPEGTTIFTSKQFWAEIDNSEINIEDTINEISTEVTNEDEQNTDEKNVTFGETSEIKEDPIETVADSETEQLHLLETEEKEEAKKTDPESTNSTLDILFTQDLTENKTDDNIEASLEGIEENSEQTKLNLEISQTESVSENDEKDIVENKTSDDNSDNAENLNEDEEISKDEDEEEISETELKDEEPADAGETFQN